MSEQSEQLAGLAIEAMLAGKDSVDTSSTEEVAADEATETVETEPSAQNAETVEAVEETASEQPGGAEDDVASLRQRLEEREAAIKQYESRLSAVRERGRQSLDAVNRRAMRAFSDRDRTAKLLKRALTEEGVDKAEAERLLAEIEGNYNPESASYRPAVTEQQPTHSPDDRDLIANEWLNDKGLTEDEAQEFGAWMRQPGNINDRDAKIRDIYSLLTVLEPRWRASSQNGAASANETVKAIKTVQNVQKRAARATSSAPGSAGGAKRVASAREKKGLSDDDVLELFQQAYGRR